MGLPARGRAPAEGPEVALTSAGPRSAEIVEALRAAGVRDVDASSRRRAEYSSDASLYRVPPACVAFPAHPDEVCAALEAARSLGVPVTARGGGTSIAGNAVGPGIVLDCARHLRRVGPLDPGARTVDVEPGVVLSDLQRAAAPHGLRFGPDPSSHNRCTIGGMVGNNACGSRALAYGRTADNVVALDVVTGAGERLRATARAEQRPGEAADAVARLATAEADVLRHELGRFARQVSGYSLEHLLPERGGDLAKALVGTEGTCALVLGATLRLARTPAATALVVLGYPDMAAAADAVPALLSHRPLALEGLDERIVDVVRRRRGPAAVPGLPAGGGWLLAEVAAEAPRAAVAAARRLAADADAVDDLVVADAAEAALLWRIREDGAGLSTRSPRGLPAHSGWEDAAVPPERLGAYLRDFEALLAEHGLATVPYGHFGDGCVHARIDFPLDAPDGLRRMRRFLLAAAALVAGHGGSMSGEHGDGRARSELLPHMYSSDALRVFGAFKAAFDPGDVLNPGVIVAPRPLDADVRAAATPVLRGRLAFAYADDGGDFAQAALRCVGIGKCRADTTAVGGVMCPSFLATGDERDSTRGRARVLQEMANGTVVTGGWRSPEVRDVLDLCLACKGCKSDCPAAVDMATYKAEALHQAYRRRPRPASHYTLGWLPRWLRLAGRAPRLATAALRAPGVAAAAKRAGGIDPRRPLPALADRRFSRWFAARQRPRPDGDPVLLWVDTFTEHLAPEVGRAAVTLLEAAGYAVEVPARRVCCGLTWLSTGQLGAAKRHARRAVEALAPAARAGTPVVGLEPSCLAVLRGDAAGLLGPGRDVEAVAGAARTLAELLGHDRRGLLDGRLDGIDVVAQPHCHHHAEMGWETDEALLRGAGATVRRVGGCCGLAGNFGMERGHYDVSVAVAETALLPAVRAAPDGAVLLADGFSCRTQLAHLAGRDAVHLAQLLAGRLPASEG